MSKYSLTIYQQGPNGTNATLSFSSEEERQEYIKRERRYTAAEFRAYVRAFDKAARQKTLKALMERRVQFARQEGFVPDYSNKGVWIRSRKVNKD